MARHERSCTANPNRVCGFHEAMRISTPEMAVLIAAFTGSGEDWEAGVKALREAADGCPACMLAAIRQSGVQRKVIAGELGEEPLHIPFAFREEVDAFWRDYNETHIHDDDVAW